MKRILAIGNSFSVDALHYFKEICDAAGIATECVNLYIGGCSLAQHAENIENDSRAYERYRNGQFSGRLVSCKEALLEQEWDIVTIQQASHDSGIPESYEPYGTRLLEYVKAFVPQAKVWFHKTWAYEHGSEHPFFPRYHSNQEEMYHAINGAAAKFVGKHGLPVIPAGDVIQKLRQQPFFDYQNGGESLCRDKFHMSMSYGRYAVAAAWVEMLTETDVRGNSFLAPDMRVEIRELIQSVAHEVCAEQRRKLIDSV